MKHHFLDPANSIRLSDLRPCFVSAHRPAVSSVLATFARSSPPRSRHLDPKLRPATTADDRPGRCAARRARPLYCSVLRPTCSSEARAWASLGAGRVSALGDSERGVGGGEVESVGFCTTVSVRLVESPMMEHPMMFTSLPRHSMAYMECLRCCCNYPAVFDSRPRAALALALAAKSTVEVFRLWDRSWLSIE